MAITVKTETIDILSINIIYMVYSVPNMRLAANKYLQKLVSFS